MDSTNLIRIQSKPAQPLPITGDCLLLLIPSLGYDREKAKEMASCTIALSFPIGSNPFKPSTLIPPHRCLCRQAFFLFHIFLSFCVWIQNFIYSSCSQCEIQEDFSITRSYLRSLLLRSKNFTLTHIYILRFTYLYMFNMIDQNFFLLIVCSIELTSTQSIPRLFIFFF